MINLSTRRTTVIGTRKYKVRIRSDNLVIAGLLTQVEELSIEVRNLQIQVESLQGQVIDLQARLLEAQELAQLRANIITYKNNYIHTLQDILDNNGIPYPPEPIYPNS